MPRSRPILLAALVLAASAPPASAQAEIKVDVGTFRYDAAQSLLEAYVSIGAASLAYQADGDGYRSDVPLRLDLMPVASGAPAGAAAEPVLTREVALSFVVPDTTALQPGQVFVEQVRAAVPPGDYTLRLVATGGDGEPEIRLERDVEVPDYQQIGDAMLSAMQVASRIEPAAEPGDPFVKSGLLIQPNPDAFYGGARTSVPYYVEVYRPEPGGIYTFLTYLAASDAPSPLPGTEQRIDRPGRRVDVVAGQVDVSAMPTGVYFLRAVVLDAENAALAETSKKIYVINPDVERPQAAQAELTYEETTFGLLGEEELEEAVDQALILANSPERAAARSLSSDEDRRAFLVRFWRDRDNDGNPYQNIAHREHLARVSGIEEQFRESAGRRGVETERGQTFVRYGPPSEIDRRPAEADKVPYEIWVYDNIVGTGRALFVFADRFKSNTFDLIHSNVQGEVSLPNWEQELIVR